MLENKTTSAYREEDRAEIIHSVNITLCQLMLVVLGCFLKVATLNVFDAIILGM